MSKNCRVGRSGLIFLLIIGKTGNSRSWFRYFIFEIFGKMMNYAVFFTFFALNFDKKLAVE
jgi:hypothetical protein